MWIRWPVFSKHCVQYVCDSSLRKPPSLLLRWVKCIGVAMCSYLVLPAKQSRRCGVPACCSLSIHPLEKASRNSTNGVELNTDCPVR
ncbi:hypothetical protein LX36DRAFT_443767 [Colletotrichum falcatum]|nr:hypothetical protein LX36DRAFT_443767 [Colletotrichum falcatum]